MMFQRVLANILRKIIHKHKNFVCFKPIFDEKDSEIVPLKKLMLLPEKKNLI